MDVQCNRFVRRTAPENRDACIYARYALAVFRAAPQSFAEFDAWLFAPFRPPPLEQLYERAEQLAGRRPLADALADPWLAKRLAEAVAIYEALGKGQIPKLLLPRAFISGPVYSYHVLDKILATALKPP
jgi:hypothetical protein